MNSWHHKTKSAQIRELNRCDMMRRKWARKLANRTAWTVTKADKLNASKAYVNKTEPKYMDSYPDDEGL